MPLPTDYGGRRHNNNNNMRRAWTTLEQWWVIVVLWSNWLQFITADGSLTRAVNSGSGNRALMSMLIQQRLLQFLAY